jgi:hypothetical protein
MAALTITQLTTPASQASWLQTLFSAAINLGLPTTSWRTGDPERVFLTMLSYLSQRFDALASAYSQGGFIDYAATGTVTIELPDGDTFTLAVSPDPSTDANPNGDTTLLDELCRQNYDVERIRLTTAGGPLAILNTSVTTYGPYAAGSYHVANPFTKATYSNTVSVTITPSTIAGTSVSTCVSSSGLIKVTTSTNHGLVTDDVVFITDVLGTTEANGAWYVTLVDPNEFTLQGSTFTNAYVSGGTVYEPTVTTVAADIGGSASGSFDASDVLAVNVVTTAVTSLINVSVSNLEIYVGTDTETNTALAARTKLKLLSLSVNGPAGAYEFFALSASIFAPLLSTPATLSTAITRVTTFVSELDGKVYVYLANASGAPSNDDITVVEAIYQAYCVPLGVFVEVAGATEVPTAVVVDVWIPAAYFTAANAALLRTAIQTYWQATPIGGYSDPAGSPTYTNKLLRVDVIGALYEAAKTAGFPLDNVVMVFDGDATITEISLPVSEASAAVPTLSPATPTLTGHPT